MLAQFIWTDPQTWSVEAAWETLRQAWQTTGSLLLVFAGCLVAGFVAGRIGRMILRRSADSFERRARMLTAVTLRSVAQSATLFAVAVGARAAVSYYLAEGRFAERDLPDLATKVLLLLAIGYAAYRMVDALDAWLQFLARRTGSQLDDMLAPLVRNSLRVVVVVFVVLYLAEVLAGRPLGTMLAGLGIGGIAVGLAAQDTLKNLFGSLMLFSDRPFEMGDRIVFEGFDGSVERIGLRSTRIRTLEGNLVAVPNGLLAGQSILNVGQRPYIRRMMNLGIIYGTPPDKVERALAIIREILADHEGMHPDLPPRVAFSDFKDWSLNIQALYWYHPADMQKFMAFGERVNLEIMRRFAAEGIEFAFPTQSLIVSGDPEQPLLVASPPEQTSTRKRDER